jgi:type IV pilus assembly protein PilM
VASPNVVGLDIGSGQIKAVHLARRRNTWSLENAAIGPTPPDSVQDGVILDIPRVTDAVKQLFRDHKFPPTGLDTVAAVSGSHVHYRLITMPEMSESTLRKTIRFEAAKHIDQGKTGVSLDNSAIECDILGKSGDPPHLDVLLVVAPMAMVSGRVSVIEGAGLEPVAVDHEAVALLRAMEAASLMPSPGQSTVVMNMGATYTDLNIVHGKDVTVTRSIPIGGNAITNSLASTLNISMEEAELHKRSTSVVAGYDEEPGTMGAADIIRQVTLPIIDELIRELRRSVIFFQSQAAEAGVNVAVEQLVLAGGAALLPGLADYLRERLGMTVTNLDPFAGHRDAAAARLQGRGIELAVATGLALKEYV